MLDLLANLVTLVPFLSALAAIWWLLAGWRRAYRYARYFQLEGYDSKRYLRWLVRSARERSSVIFTLACLLIVVAVRLIVSLAQMQHGVDAIILSAVAALLGLVNLLISPSDRKVNQPFNATPRARRLLVTVFLVVAMLPGWFVIRLAANYLNTVSLDFLDVALQSGLIGIVAALAWLSLPVANLLMFPVEGAFRRYFLAQARRNLDRSGVQVIAITGSYGKTSTKYYLNHILGARFRVLMTPKSYNTLLGISRVINETLVKDASYEYFIVETDAYFVGENAMICKLVRPQIGMVMTVGPMHLERLGSMENIAKAQYEVIEALPANGVGIFNTDDPAILEMAKHGYPHEQLLVSRLGLPAARFVASAVIMRADGLHFTLHDRQTNEDCVMFAPLYGEHNVTNILMATAVARQLGMSFAEIAPRVATLEPAEHRLNRRVLADGTVIIDDAYSANPVGTQTALQVLALQQQIQDEGKRRIVISSGMFELGALSVQENRHLGERIAEVATDAILIGPTQTAAVQDGLKSKDFPAAHLHIVNTLDEAIAAYRAILQPGDALLMLTDLPDTYA